MLKAILKATGAVLGVVAIGTGIGAGLTNYPIITSVVLLVALGAGVWYTLFLMFKGS